MNHDDERGNLLLRTAGITCILIGIIILIIAIAI